MQKTYTNLRTLRLAEGLKQSELCAIVGAAKGSISSIELGHTKTGGVVERLAELFEVPVKVLVSTNERLVQFRLSKHGSDSLKEAVKLVRPEDHEPKPMYAARPTVKPTAKSTDIEAPVVKEEAKVEPKEETKVEAVKEPSIEQQMSLADKGIVQVLTCTSGAANKYLSNGWILLSARPKGDGNEFVLLLGSVKPFSNEDFERIKTADRGVPHYAPKGWRGF